MAVAIYGDVLARFGQALSDPTRARILLALRDAPAYPLTWPRWLAWASLGWMAAEGAVGLAAGLAAGSAALTGWALGSCVEALASMIVIWRFTGAGDTRRAPQ